ncbi:MAG: 2OG-Fe(II) oxygenase [Myxococcales bacterium]|nr:2OG-Fe(II) oxygenase [Myxococcales bacterium]
MPDVVVPGAGRPYLEGDSLDHTAPLIWTIPDVLSAAECEAAIARIEALGPTAAPVTTGRGFEMLPEIRNNTRVVFDDAPLAAELFSRVRPHVPAQLAGMQAIGTNERFRCYKYDPGQRFAPHYDGAFVRSERERSLLTLIVYLNDDYVGGSTAFHDFIVRVRPQRGTALLFQHLLLHEGCVVTSGTKYAMRSDVMYRTIS